MRARWISWLMLAVWASWLTGAQSVLVGKTALGAWVPDAGVALVVACAARFHARDVPRTALLLGLVRCAYSVEPPVALLAGFLGAGLGVYAVRTYVEVAGPLASGVLAGLSALGLRFWLVLVEGVRAGAEGTVGAAGLGGSPLGGALRALPGLVPTALTTGLLAFAAGAALAHLPGLTPLRRRRW